MKAKRNYAFIDSQNLNVGIQRQGWKLDFGRLRSYLLEKYNVEKAFLFIGHVPGNEKLYESLQKEGYVLVFKPTLTLPDGKVKGNVDAELVLHAVAEFPNYNKAVIISCDGDFHCLAEYLTQKNKLLSLMLPDGNKSSSLLRKFSQHLAPMNRLKERLELKKGRKTWAKKPPFPCPMPLGPIPQAKTACPSSSTTLSPGKKRNSGRSRRRKSGSTAAAPRKESLPRLAGS